MVCASPTHSPFFVLCPLSKTFFKKPDVSEDGSAFETSYFFKSFRRREESTQKNEIVSVKRPCDGPIPRRSSPSNFLQFVSQTRSSGGSLPRRPVTPYKDLRYGTILVKYVSLRFVLSHVLLCVNASRIRIDRNASRIRIDRNGAIIYFISRFVECEVTQANWKTKSD